jgi:hypothetical protein
VAQLFSERLLAAIKAPFESLISPTSGFSLLFLGLTLLFCAGIYAVRARRHPGQHGDVERRGLASRHQPADR